MNQLVFIQMSHVISELLYYNFGALNRDYGGGNFVILEKGLFYHRVPASHIFEGFHCIAQIKLLLLEKSAVQITFFQERSWADPA